MSERIPSVDLDTKLFPAPTMAALDERYTPEDPDLSGYVTATTLATELEGYQPAGSYARVVAASIGNGAATTIAVVHGLGTRDVVVQLRQSVAPYAQRVPEIRHTDLDTVTLLFAVAPTAGEYVAIIQG